MMIKNRLKIKAVRTGSALLVVLAIVMVVTILSFAFISRSDIELACGRNMVLRAKADFLAGSALEHARGLILNPQEIDTQYWAGATGQYIEAGDYYYDVTVEPNLSFSGPTRWCNYDISCQAYKSTAGQRTGFTRLKALLRLDPCISYWSDTSDARQLLSAVTVNGDVYCRGDLKNFGTINGDVFCDTLTGVIGGQQASWSDLSLEWPRVIADDFTSHYMVETVDAILAGQTFGPDDPVRVCHRVGDLDITGDVQIDGMLIVEGNLKVTSSGNYIRAAKNLPALLVTGDLKVDPDAQLGVQGLAVIDGTAQVNVGCQDVNVLGAIFAKGGIVQTTKDSINSHDAVIVNQPAWRPAGGQNAGAVEFDGSDDRIEELDAGSYLNGLSAITVSLWVKSDVTNQDRGIFFTREPTDYTGELGLRYDKNGFEGGATSCIKVSLKTSLGNTQVESSSSVQTAAWQHLALVWSSGSSLKLYINGVQDSPTYDKGPVAGVVSDVQKFMLGRGPKGQYWNGLIDDVRIYNRALDDTNDIYPPKDGLSGLIAHWKLDEDTDGDLIISAAPADTAIIVFSEAGAQQRWAQAAGAFFKAIRRY